MKGWMYRLIYQGFWLLMGLILLWSGLVIYGIVIGPQLISDEMFLFTGCCTLLLFELTGLVLDVPQPARYRRIIFNSTWVLLGASLTEKFLI